MKKIFTLAALAVVASAGFSAQADVTKVSEIVGTYDGHYESDQFNPDFTFPTYDTNVVVSRGTAANEVIIKNLFSVEEIGENSFSAILDVENQTLVITNKQHLNDEYSIWISEWVPGEVDFTYPETYSAQINSDGTVVFCVGGNDAYGLNNLADEAEKANGTPAFLYNAYDLSMTPVEVGGEDEPDDPNAAVESILTGNAPVLYFDLKGRQVENPVKGNVVIKKQGNQTIKMIAK